MEKSRQHLIEELAGDGNLVALKKLFENHYTQLELDIALENAIAYSEIKIAEYLLSLGASFSNYDYQGVYYAVHNNEIEGLKFSISKGVDINISKGMLLNTSILTAINTKSITIVQWLLENGAERKWLTDDSKKTVKRWGFQALKNLLEIDH